MIPLISSIAYGPLDVCHLPRFWWKVLLRRAGLLDEEYPDCGGGLDAAVLNVLRLDKDATLSFLRENMPTYLALEDWVVAQTNGGPDREAVAQWNANIRARQHTRPEKIAETYRDIGLSEDAGIASAVLLNSLQDWQLWVRRDLDGGFEGVGGRVVPLISTVDYGPTGVCQLPRTWHKLLLDAKGLLHPDYPAMTQTGLDPRALAVVGIQPEDAVSYVREALPTYLQFEGWILERNGGRVEADRVREWNAAILGRSHHEAKRAEIFETVGRDFGGHLTSGAILNHVEDWHYAHADLTAHSG